MIADRFIRIAGLWFAACVTLGAVMGARHDFTDVHVHVHGNLLGWVSCSLFALAHKAWPRLSTIGGATVHFWLHNVGLVVFIAGLAGVSRQAAWAAPLLGVASCALVLAALLFCVMVWRVTSPRTQAAEPLLRAAGMTA